MGRPRKNPITGETEMHEDQPQSRTAILDALAPHIMPGPAGLTVIIGVSKITMKRESRKLEFARNADIDTLIDAAVELTGPLTEEEIKKILAQFKDIEYKFVDDHVVMTLNKRSLISHMEVPLSHILAQAIELTGPRERFRPVTGEGGKQVAPGEIQ